MVSSLSLSLCESEPFTCVGVRGRSFLGVLVLLAVRVDLLAPRPFVVLGLVSLTLCPWACAVGRTFRCLGAILAQGHLSLSISLY